jgi:site-specific DNA-methyltransferase (cytosine-N4-specific)
VRYGGEVISVDFISTELAEQIGFKPIKVYSLKQQKGNSSQQMAKFGRVPLRKSILYGKSRKFMIYKLSTNGITN